MQPCWTPYSCPTEATTAYPFGCSFDYMSSLLKFRHLLDSCCKRGVKSVFNVYIIMTMKNIFCNSAYKYTMIAFPFFHSLLLSLEFLSCFHPCFSSFLKSLPEGFLCFFSCTNGSFSLSCVCACVCKNICIFLFMFLVTAGQGCNLLM